MNSATDQIHDEGPGWTRRRPGSRSGRRGSGQSGGSGRAGQPSGSGRSGRAVGGRGRKPRASVSATRLIDASPDRLWRMISDITRMGEWSTEAGAGRWLSRHPGPRVGARFVGSNRRKWRRWVTTCRVVDSEPGVVFAFESTGGPFRIARWSYRFELEGNRTRVTETWIDQRGHLMKWAGRWISGVRDRATYNHETMVATLNALAKAATSA